MESRTSGGTVRRWHFEVGYSAGCGTLSAEEVEPIERCGHREYPKVFCVAFKMGCSW
jgi:hypothetical protein